MFLFIFLAASEIDKTKYPDVYEDCTDAIEEFPTTSKMTLQANKVYCLYTTQTFFIFGDSDITLAAKYKSGTVFTSEDEAEAVNKAAGVVIPQDTYAIARIVVAAEDEYSFALGARPSPSETTGDIGEGSSFTNTVIETNVFTTETDLEYEIRGGVEKSVLNNKIYTNSIQWLTSADLQFKIDSYNPSGVSGWYSTSTSMTINEEDMEVVTGEGQFLEGRVLYFKPNTNKLIEMAGESDDNFNFSIIIKSNPKVPFIWLFQSSPIPRFTIELDGKTKIIPLADLKQIGEIQWSVYAILVIVALVVVVILIILCILRCICCCCRKGKHKHKKSKKDKKDKKSSSSSSSSSYSSNFSTSSRKDNQYTGTNQFYLG